MSTTVPFASDHLPKVPNYFLTIYHQKFHLASIMFPSMWYYLIKMVVLKYFKKAIASNP